MGISTFSIFLISNIYWKHFEKSREKKQIPKKIIKEKTLAIPNIWNTRDLLYSSQVFKSRDLVYANISIIYIRNNYYFRGIYILASEKGIQKTTRIRETRRI